MASLHLPDDQPVVAWRPAKPASGPLTFRSLTVSDMPAFRALRLDALRSHPEAFVPAYEEERSVDPALLGAGVQTAWISDGSFMLGAYRHDRLVGVVGVRRSSRYKQRHRATLWILFTQPSMQGHGLGRLLLEAALDRCWRTPGLELLHLTVGSESAAARHLYISVGFQPYGMDLQAMKLEDRYIDVELMALRLHPGISAQHARPRHLDGQSRPQ